MLRELIDCLPLTCRMHPQTSGPTQGYDGPPVPGDAAETTPLLRISLQYPRSSPRPEPLRRPAPAFAAALCAERDRRAGEATLKRPSAPAAYGSLHTS